MYPTYPVIYCTHIIHKKGVKTIIHETEQACDCYGAIVGGKWKARASLGLVIYHYTIHEVKTIITQGEWEPE